MWSRNRQIAVAIDNAGGVIFRRMLFSVFLGLSFLSMTSNAQGPIQPVQWSGSVKSGTPLKHGSKVAIELSAKIQSGWHVYGLSQAAGGPTPLQVTLDPNEIVRSAGAVSGTPPLKKHDSSFDLETESYLGSFALYLPAQVNDHPTAGKQVVSVAVRFQACSDRTCLPPRTVHVSVPIEILSGT